MNNDLFTSLYAMLDDYSDKLITGMVTGELQTNLTAALTSLQEQTNQLKYQIWYFFSGMEENKAEVRCHDGAGAMQRPEGKETTRR